MRQGITRRVEGGRKKQKAKADEQEIVQEGAERRGTQIERNLIEEMVQEGVERHGKQIEILLNFQAKGTGGETKSIRK